MTAFVVTHQNYVYGVDEIDEIKYVLNDNFSVQAVFSTKQSAEQFINLKVKDTCEEWESDEEHERMRYDIWNMEVDKK